MSAPEHRRLELAPTADGELDLVAALVYRFQQRFGRWPDTARAADLKAVTGLLTPAEIQALRERARAQMIEAAGLELVRRGRAEFVGIGADGVTRIQRRKGGSR